MIRRIGGWLPLLTAAVFAGLGLGAFLTPARLGLSLGILPMDSAGYGAIRGDLGAFFLGIAALSLLGMRANRQTLLNVPIALLCVVVGGRIIAEFANGHSAANLRAMSVELALLAALIMGRFATRSAAPARLGRVLLVLGGLLAPALFGLMWFGKEIGMAVFRRILESAVTQPLLPTLGEGMHAGLCGSGAPLADPGRAGPCVFVIAGKRIYIVDAGDGTPRRMSLMRVPVGQIEAIFITHFHSDHIGGLGEMMLQRWTSVGRQQPVDVYGPQGVESVVDGFNRAYQLDGGYRVAHHGPQAVPPTGRGGTPHPFNIVAGESKAQVILQKDGLTVTAFPVNHAPVFPAVGYRFDYRGRSIVVSGDTAPSESLVANAKGADILFHEGLQTAMVNAMEEIGTRHPFGNLAKIAHDIPSYHTSPEAAAREAAQAGVRYLVFYHIIPPLPLALFNAAFLADSAKYFTGPIVLGHDGTMLSLPPESHTVTIRELL